jgi:hypothetical protein
MGEAERTLGLDPQNVDALLAQLFLIPPFGRFVDGVAIVERLQRAPGGGAGQILFGWYSRNVGWIRETAEIEARSIDGDGFGRTVCGFVYGFALIVLGSCLRGWRLRLFLNHDLVPPWFVDLRIWRHSISYRLPVRIVAAHFT